MDKRLALLETTRMQGDDGRRYVVRAYEHLALTTHGVEEHWDSTGQVEYRLEDGRRVEVGSAGQMTISGCGVALQAAEAPRPAVGRTPKKGRLPQHARA